MALDEVPNAITIQMTRSPATERLAVVIGLLIVCLAWKADAERQ
jgi:hypothetical protein